MKLPASAAIYRAAIGAEMSSDIFNAAGFLPAHGVPLPPRRDAGIPNMVTSSPFAEPWQTHSRSAKTNTQRIFGSHQRYRTVRQYQPDEHPAKSSGRCSSVAE